MRANHLKLGWNSFRVARSLEIFSRTFCFSINTVDYFHGCPQRGENAFPPWKLGLRTKKY